MVKSFLEIIFYILSQEKDYMLKTKYDCGIHKNRWENTLRVTMGTKSDHT